MPKKKIQNIICTGLMVVGFFIVLPFSWWNILGVSMIGIGIEGVIQSYFE